MNHIDNPRDVLWIPFDDSEIHTVNAAALDNFVDDPYAVARDLLTDESKDYKVDTAVLLPTPFKNIFMFIDEDAMLRSMPLNSYASFRMYPAHIYGHAILMSVRQVETPETLDLRVGHLPLGVTRKLKSLLEGS